MIEYSDKVVLTYNRLYFMAYFIYSCNIMEQGCDEKNKIKIQGSVTDVLSKTIM